MIQKGTFLNVYDNSGAFICQVISSDSAASIGDLITVSIKQTKKSKQSKSITKGQVAKAIITQTKKGWTRFDGSHYSFDTNGCVLVNQKRLPLGSRVMAFTSYELRLKKCVKLLALSRLFT